jgi:uroporphyrinogen-III synthase
MRLVVTRPQADGERTAATLRARGHHVLLAPLMQVEPIAADMRSGWGGVIITSANAASAIAGNPALKVLCELPLFAVGQRSADAARRAGFANVISAGGDVRDLVRLIAERRADAAGPLLYLAGEDRAADLVSELIMHGIAAEMVVVYRAATAPFPPELTAVLKAAEVDAVLHFSRRSAENYIAGAEQAGVAKEAREARHICLSAQIAVPLAEAGARRIAIAPRPDEAALIGSLDEPPA